MRYRSDPRPAPRRPLVAFVRVAPGRAALAALVLAWSGGCGGTSTSAPGGDRPGADLGGTVIVFAAASLSASFTELGERFEADHPGTRVVVSSGASSALASQILEGAPADVFASADRANVERLDAAGRLASAPRIVARNRLAILVGPGNPRGIRRLADLARPDLTVVVCADQVPCGQYSRRVLDAAGVSIAAKSLERDVNGVVTKVASGEADAGIGYLTDARRSGGAVEAVEIEPSDNVVADAPIVVVGDAPNRRGGEAFVELVLGAEGRRVLSEAGFESGD